MEIYKNLSGRSGVFSYESGADFIVIQFGTGSIYTYSYSSAGKENIEEMKRLAVQGKGLNSFINLYVRYLYVK